MIILSTLWDVELFNYINNASLEIEILRNKSENTQELSSQRVVVMYHYSIHEKSSFAVTNCHFKFYNKSAD